MNTTSGYRIGKVSKLTGISADTLRIWERRYSAVVPVRTEAGGRLYSADDIARLKLIKSLVDGGDAIGNVATLNAEQLQARLGETSDVISSGLPDTPLGLVAVGEGLAARLETIGLAGHNLTVNGSFASVRQFSATDGPIVADVLVVDIPTLHDDTAKQVTQWLEQSGASHAVLIYRYANQSALDRLPRKHSSHLRSPATAQTIIEHINNLRVRQADTADRAGQGAKDLAQPAPARKYSDQALARIAAISPVINCECPHHLAELITSLIAFEKYSGECESRSREDAELHAYLATTASHARHIIENALDMVIEIENIEV